MWDMMYLQNIIWSVISSLIFACHYFIFPNDPAYAFEILTNSMAPYSQKLDISTISTAAIYWIYGLFNTFLAFKMNFTVTFITDMLHLSFFVLAPLISKELRIKQGNWLDESINKDPTFHKTSRNLRKLENLTMFYRTLQIILRYFSESFGLLATVGHLVMLNLSVYNQISLMTHWSQLNNPTRALLLSCHLLGNLIYLCALDMLGRLVTESGKTIKSWRPSEFLTEESKSSVKVMKKFKKSCKPLMVVYKNFYFVRRSTVLSFLKHTSNVTFRALIAIHKR